MPGATVPVGLGTLQVMHHVSPQPSTTSWRLACSSWCLSGPCCSPHRVVYGAEAQGLMGCLYTSWHCCIPSLHFTAHGDPGVGLAQAPQALGDVLALGTEALMLVARCFHRLLDLLQACGSLWGT